MVMRLPLLPLLLLLSLAGAHGSNWVLGVKYKYAGRQRSLVDLKAHDNSRQLGILAGVDLPLGGSGRPDSVGLYYAKIGIGTPSKDYYVQVDTGSDIMWVNCINCRECPRRSSLGIDLTLYNLMDSRTARLVSCAQEFCLDLSAEPFSGCTVNTSCTYYEFYGDESSTSGYFVKDFVQYDMVSGDLNTTSANGSVIFGCGARQLGNLASSKEALDGVLGFGKANTSVISQLASSGKVRKMFAHCLDGTNGGGIFVIGRVMQPKVKTTPLVPNQKHYNVNMTAVEVGRDFLYMPRELFGIGEKIGTIIDSGTTLAYLPEVVYEQLVDKIIFSQSDLKVHTVHEEYTCFDYSGSADDLDDGFPPVTLHFENLLRIKVLPHEYLFPKDDLWCIGWQNSGNQSRDRKDMTLLGDLVLSNKLVVYDLEKQAIGWTEYNCSSSIKVKDEQTGTVHLVGSHFISRACIPSNRSSAIIWLLTLLLHRLAFHGS